MTSFGYNVLGFGTQVSITQQVAATGGTEATASVA